MNGRAGATWSTTFEYSNLQLSAEQMTRDGSISVFAEITNTGNVEATEIVQLYIRDLVGQVTRPVKELKGFQRLTLKPGESRRAEFELKAQQCGFHGLDNTFVVEPGDMKVWIGWNSAEGLEANFKIVE